MIDIDHLLMSALPAGRHDGRYDDLAILARPSGRIRGDRGPGGRAERVRERVHDRVP
jgi:hypothetical protein